MQTAKSTSCPQHSLNPQQACKDCQSRSETHRILTGKKSTNIRFDEISSNIVSHTCIHGIDWPDEKITNLNRRQGWRDASMPICRCAGGLPYAKSLEKDLGRRFVGWVDLTKQGAKDWVVIRCSCGAEVLKRAEDCRRTPDGCTACRPTKIAEKKRTDSAVYDETAESKGGRHHSKELLNLNDLHTWSCANSTHPRWQATGASVILGGTWCPECRASIGENLIREYLRLRANYAPDAWAELRLTIYGRKHQIDCVARFGDQEIWVEVHGSQHYQKTHRFTRPNGEQRKSDRRVRRYAKQKGIILIEFKWADFEKSGISKAIPAVDKFFTEIFRKHSLPLNTKPLSSIDMAAIYAGKIDLVRDRFLSAADGNGYDVDGPYTGHANPIEVRHRQCGTTSSHKTPHALESAWKQGRGYCNTCSNLERWTDDGMCRFLAEYGDGLTYHLGFDGNKIKNARSKITLHCRHNRPLDRKLAVYFIREYLMVKKHGIRCKCDS